MYGKSQKYLTADKWTDGGYVEKTGEPQRLSVFPVLFLSSKYLSGGMVENRRYSW